LSQPVQFWQTKSRYDGAEYDLSHLAPLSITMQLSGGKSIPLMFRFSYHCCSDKIGKRDLGTRINENTRPDEERYFCPVRWFMSLKLPSRVKSLETVRLAPVPGYQWIHTEKVTGISIPWAIWFKVMPGPPGGATVVGVESAYLAASAPKGGKADTFRFIAEQTRRTGNFYGTP